MQTIRMWFTDSSKADTLILRLKHLVMPGDLASNEARRLFKPYSVFRQVIAVNVCERCLCDLKEIINLGLDNADRTELYIGDKQWALLSWALPTLHQKHK